MPYSERIAKIRAFSENLSANEPQNTYDYDTHRFAKDQFCALPRWEKIARSTAAAIENQTIYIEPFDRIIGRVFLFNTKKVEDIDRDFDHITEAYARILAEIEDYAAFAEFPDVVGDTHYSFGHMSWNWNAILKYGTSGLKQRCQDNMSRTDDPASHEYYKGVIILLTALENWNDLHVKKLREMGMTEQAELCEKVPRYPAETFYEAVQAFYMQYIVVMRENPGGGNSPGRLDYYLWPYLEKDLAEKRCTMEEARELIDELFIRINERIWKYDGWVETIVVGGSHPNGTSAVNPLSYMMIDAFKELKMTHPAVYARIPENSPEEWLDFCADYLITCDNRGQLLYDKTIIDALCKNGVPYEDAVEYYCGGCMEIGIQGKTNNYLFNAWHNMTKMVELAVTKGLSLSDGKVLKAFRSKGLENYDTFDAFYADFIKEVKRILNMFFKAQDIYSEVADKAYPRYLLTSMIDDCIKLGKNMHSGGVRYPDYGSLPIGLPDAADYLFAIKKAVYDDKICTAQELVDALKANFKGHETLRKQLIQIPKYGQDHDEANSFANKYMSDVSDIYTSYVTRFGGRGKMVVFTFNWAPVAGEQMGATASGKLAGTPVAHGVTPHSSSMTEGITAAMNSCNALDFTKFNGGASTMWDLDSSWVTPGIVKALFMTFFKQGGQIFQGNTTDVKELIEAQQHPEDFPNLMVRVGGFSARFINLKKNVQDEIIGRIRHNC